MSLQTTADPGDLWRLAPMTLHRTAPTFESFFRQSHPRIVALLVAMVGRATAEDLAQEAFVRAHRDWAAVATYDKPEAWVRRVAVNLAISAQRRRANEGRALLRLASRTEATVAPASTGDDELWAAVRQLPARQAAAVALRYVEDLSVAEIAAALGCAEGTAKALLHQGRTALAARLHEDDHDDANDDDGGTP